MHFQNLSIGFYAHLMLLVLYILDKKNKSHYSIKTPIY